MSARAWGRLLRLSLLPSAVADAAAGVCLGARGVLPLRWEVLGLVLASSCVYHGGMALNDWADRGDDARTRPDRPLPSGAIAAPAALTAAALLLVAGPLAALSANPRAGLGMALVAALAALYDLRARGPWSGPLLLGACRGLNLAVGVQLGVDLSSPWFVAGTSPLATWAPLLYGLYVVCASRVGRLEDVQFAEVPAEAGPPAALARPSAKQVGGNPGGGSQGSGTLGRAPSLYVGVCAVLLGALPTLEWLLRALGARELLRDPRSFSLLFALPAFVASAALLRESAPTHWTPALAGRATGMALRRLMVFTATLAALSTFTSAEAHAPIARTSVVAGTAVALAILAGLGLSFALRRVFPPT